MHAWEKSAPDVPSPEAALPKGVVHRFENGTLRLTIPIDVYGMDAIFRSCYWLTNRCYLYLAPPQGGLLDVTLVAKEGGVPLTDRLAWDFLNDLVDQRLRIDINRETRTIREMIVAQAFAETDLIDNRGRTVSEASEASQSRHDDPEGIQTWRPMS